MREVCVLIPVKCPQCETVDHVAFPIVVVVTAVTRWKQMRLYSTCHEVFWDASASEIQSIREHVGERWLESERRRLAVQRQAIFAAPQPAAG